MKKELEKLEKKLKTKNFGSVFFSSVTDPYLPMEAKYQLTRKCLEVLVNFGYEGTVVIQTKSPLVTRDIEVFKRLKRVAVGFTVTTLDDKVSQFLEVKAPPVSARLKGLKELHNAGIPTYAFVGPILPYFINSQTKINQLKAADLIPEFEKADTEEYRKKLEEIIHKAMKGRKLKMGLGKVIYHHKLPKKR